VQHDRGAATFYTPGPRLQHPEGRILPVDVSDTLAKESGDLGEKSGDLGEKSGDLGEKSGNLGEKSGNLELPRDLEKAVGELNRWTPQPDLRRLIGRLCTWRPMSAAELAMVLERTQTYLRTSYLGPMIRAGELAYTIPGKPNDPNQRYRAATPVHLEPG
jgi:hypothetical protein